MTNVLLNKANTINSISSVIESIVAPAIMLLMVPVFLNILGSESFAVWILVNSFVASLMALSFGGGNTIIKYISDQRYKDNFLFSSIFIFQLLILLILSVIFFSISLILEEFFVNSLFAYTNYIIAIFVIKQLESLNYAFCKGKERYDISSILSSSAKLVFLGTQLIALIYTNDLNLVFEYAIIAALFLYLIQIIILKNIYSDFKLFHSFKITNIKLVLSYSIWNWYLSLVGIIFSNFDKWLVGIVMGFEVLGYYAVAVLFFNQTYMIINSLVAWFFPMVSRKGMTSEIVYLYNALTKGIAFLTILASLFLINFNQLFIFWLGTDNYILSSQSIYLFICLLPAFSLRIIPHFMLLARGQVRKKFFYDAIALFVRGIIGIFILNSYGINVLITGFLIDMVITIILYNYSFYKHLDNLSKIVIAITLLFSIVNLYYYI